MFTAVVDAKPVIVFGVAFAGNTCLRSNPTREFAATDTAGTRTTPSIATVTVDDDVAAFANTMLVTTATDVVLGAVYSVVLVVAAAVLASALDVTVIICCTFL
jgi:hypothetical protein